MIDKQEGETVREQKKGDSGRSAPMTDWIVGWMTNPLKSHHSLGPSYI